MQNSSKKTAARKMLMQCLSCDDNFFDENKIPLTTRPDTTQTPSRFTIKYKTKNNHFRASSNL